MKSGIPRRGPLSLTLAFLTFSLAAGWNPRLLFCQTAIIEGVPKFIFAGPHQKPFNATRHLIPLNQIQIGTLSKDDIPALNHPTFVGAAQANGILRKSDRVLGIFINGQAKAYPVRIGRGLRPDHPRKTLPLWRLRTAVPAECTLLRPRNREPLVATAF